MAVSDKAETKGTPAEVDGASILEAIDFHNSVLEAMETQTLAEAEDLGLIGFDRYAYWYSKLFYEAMDLWRNPTGVQYPHRPAPAADAVRPNQPHPDVEYRRGYKAGWKKAKEGGQLDPSSLQGKSQDYIQGYNHGHSVRTHAGIALHHAQQGDAINREIDQQLKDDPNAAYYDEVANRKKEAEAHHFAADKHALDNVLGPYFHLNQRIQPERMGGWVHNFVTRDLGNVVARADKHVDDETAHLATGGQPHPQEGGTDHPADFPNILLGKIGYAGRSEREKQEIEFGRGGRMSKKKAQELYQGMAPETHIAPMNVPAWKVAAAREEDPVKEAAKKELAQKKAEIAATAGKPASDQPSAPKPESPKPPANQQAGAEKAKKKGRGSSYAEAPTNDPDYENWKKSVEAFIDANPKKFPTTMLGVGGKTLNVAQAMKDMVHHPHGVFSPTSRQAALQKQNHWDPKDPRHKAIEGKIHHAKNALHDEFANHANEVSRFYWRRYHAKPQDRIEQFTAQLMANDQILETEAKTAIHIFTSMMREWEAAESQVVESTSIFDALIETDVNSRGSGAVDSPMDDQPASPTGDADENYAFNSPKKDDKKKAESLFDGLLKKSIFDDIVKS